MPIIVSVVILLIVGAIALKTSWIGQVMTNPVKEDPLTKISAVDARTTIENQIAQGLASIGSKGKFTYKSGEQVVDKSAPGDIELTVDTSIKDKAQKSAIVNPIKQYMGPARMTTLTINDTPRHRTWTYTATIAAPQTQEPIDLDKLGPNATNNNTSPTAAPAPAPAQTSTPAQAPLAAPTPAPSQAPAPAPAPSTNTNTSPAPSPEEQKLNQILQGQN